MMTRSSRSSLVCTGGVRVPKSRSGRCLLALLLFTSFNITYLFFSTPSLHKDAPAPTHSSYTHPRNPRTSQVVDPTRVSSVLIICERIPLFDSRGSDLRLLRVIQGLRAHGSIVSLLPLRSSLSRDSEVRAHHRVKLLELGVTILDCERHTDEKLLLSDVRSRSDDDSDTHTQPQDYMFLKDFIPLYTCPRFYSQSVRAFNPLSTIVSAIFSHSYSLPRFPIVLFHLWFWRWPQATIFKYTFSLVRSLSPASLLVVLSDDIHFYRDYMMACQKWRAASTQLSSSSAPQAQTDHTHTLYESLKLFQRARSIFREEIITYFHAHLVLSINDFDSLRMRQLLLSSTQAYSYTHSHSYSHASRKLARICSRTNDASKSNANCIPISLMHYTTSLPASISNPPPIDTNLRRLQARRYTTTRGLLFVGGPNVINENSIIWFITSILPIIRQHSSQLSRVVLTIIGRLQIPADILQAHKKSVIHIGQVSEGELRMHIQKARVFVSPINAGTGINTKNVLALSWGLPLVTTSIGAQGLYLSNRCNFTTTSVTNNNNRNTNGDVAFVCDTAVEFAGAVIRAYTEQPLWEHLFAVSPRHVASYLGHNTLKSDIQRLFHLSQVIQRSVLLSQYDRTYEQAYITRLVREEDFQSVCALAQSLRDTHTRRNIVVLALSAALSLPQQILLESICDRVIYFDAQNLMKDMSERSSRSKREFLPLLLLLRVWSLTEYQKVVYLDHEMVAIQNIDELFHRPVLSALADSIHENDFDLKVMVLSPCTATYDNMVIQLDRSKELIARVVNSKQEISAELEAQFLNARFADWKKRHSSHQIPGRFGSSARFANVFDFLFGQMNVKAVHYPHSNWKINVSVLQHTIHTTHSSDGGIINGVDGIGRDAMLNGVNAMHTMLFDGSDSNGRGCEQEPTSINARATIIHSMSTKLERMFERISWRHEWLQHGFNTSCELRA